MTPSRISPEAAGGRAIGSARARENDTRFTQFAADVLRLMERGDVVDSIDFGELNRLRQAAGLSAVDIALYLFTQETLHDFVTDDGGNHA